jgi:glycyl-tRNA synthetase
MPDVVTMDKVVSLAKRRGFVFPSSEIYGGLGSAYDYGHYGVLLKENVKARWLEAMVRERDDIVALDSSIILHPAVWEASGHVAGFSDPLVDCRFCKRRYRADHLEESQCGQKPSKRPGETEQCDLTEPRQFNLMFSTRIGALEESGLDAYLGPETAQGIFVNFKNVAQIARRKPPFGIAQVGKAFRNEITPGNFIFRTLEFEQMEMEYFVPPGRGDQWFEYWVEQRVAWHLRYGIRQSHLRVRPHEAEELSHYSSATSDIEYLHPIGWTELEGIAHRGDFDLTAHTQASGRSSSGSTARSGTRRTSSSPRSASTGRCSLSSSTRTTRRSSPSASGRCCGSIRRSLPSRSPCCRSSPERGHVVEGARAVRGAPAGGRRRVRRLGPDRPRYRRQDEIGTPYALTIDEQTLEDDTVTIRDRDSLEQERIPIAGARALVLDRLAGDWTTPKPTRRDRSGPCRRRGLDGRVRIRRPLEREPAATAAPPRRPREAPRRRPPQRRLDSMVLRLVGHRVDEHEGVRDVLLHEQPGERQAAASVVGVDGHGAIRCEHLGVEVRVHLGERPRRRRRRRSGATARKASATPSSR